MVNEPDQRLFALMKEALENYNVNSLSNLLMISNKIDSIISSFNDVDPSWKEAVRTEWWELEYTAALMIDNQKEVLSKEDEEVVSKALYDMKVLLKEYEHS